MGRKRPPWYRQPWLQPTLAGLAAAYIRLVHRSGRWELRYDAAAAQLIRERRPFIGAFWHGRLLMMDPVWRAMIAELEVVEPLQRHMIMSAHRDGRLIARAIGRFGAKVLSGSTKHGAGLFRAALRVIETGQIAVITPDGPRGPRMRAKPGVVRLAMASGVPIVPATFAAANQRLLGSWDRFALALPFARGVLMVGAPLHVAVDADPEAARREVERRLTELTAEADRAVGRTPVEPA